MGELTLLTIVVIAVGATIFFVGYDTGRRELLRRLREEARNENDLYLVEESFAVITRERLHALRLAERRLLSAMRQWKA